jgi:hypothetical protein
MPVIDWIKRNKLSSILLLLLLVFFGKNFLQSFLGVSTFSSGGVSRSLSYNKGMVSDVTTPMGLALPTTGGGSMMPINEAAPQANVPKRLVIQDSDLSLLVKDVVSTKDSIITYAQTNGGYMVSANVSNPTDAPSATVVVRVASAKMKEALVYLHSLSLKVVSENVNGTDVTDQYVDVDTRVSQLLATRAKFETLLSQAKEISDITNLTQQILNIQSQIDNYKGQQDAMKKNADLAKLTVYLSTDEIALPYAPSDTFRPGVIFKLAVRSLVADLRKVATSGIWLAVYAVVWLPVVIIAVFVYRKFFRKTSVVRKTVN